MTLTPPSNGFKSGKVPRRRGEGLRSQQWNRVLDELFRLHARGQDEGLPFLESIYKRTSVRSAIETALVNRGEGHKYGVECIADPEPGQFWIALTTRHTVPQSRMKSLKKTPKGSRDLTLPLSSADDVAAGIEAALKELLARLPKKAE